MLYQLILCDVYSHVIVCPDPLGDDGSWAVDETAQRKVFVKLGVYELVSLALTTCIVYCPGSTMTKVREAPA